MAASGLRTKITLNWLAVNLVASVVVGFLVNDFAGRRYRESFLQSKLAVAKTVASSIDGDVLAGFTDPEATSDPEYRRYQRYLQAVKRSDPYVSYLYVVVRDPESGELLYAIDADVVESDTVWVETDYFAFRFSLRDGRPVVVFEEQEHASGFPL